MRFRGVRRTLVIGLIGLLPVAPAAAKTGTATVPTPEIAQAQLDIFNFGQIDSGYYRGGELKGNAAERLAALGVKTVIDLRSNGDYDPAEAQLVSAAGMQYLRIPMTTRTAPTTEQIATFLTVVKNAAQAPVYVHCVEGRHRTGVMTAIYRMTIDGWDAERAFAEMKQYKFGADFLHPEFKKFVYAYRPAPTGAVDADATVALAN